MILEFPHNADRTPASALRPPRAGSLRDDPIFAAMAAHRIAMAEFSNATDISATLEPGDECDAANKVTTRAFDDLEAAGVRLLNIRPATVMGLMALLTYLAECLCDDEQEWKLPAMLLCDGEGYGCAKPDERRAKSFAYCAVASIERSISSLMGAGQLMPPSERGDA